MKVDRNTIQELVDTVTYQRNKDTRQLYSPFLEWASSLNPPIYPRSSYYFLPQFGNESQSYPADFVARYGDVNLLQKMARLNPPRLPNIDGLAMAARFDKFEVLDFLFDLDKSIVNRYFEDNINAIEERISFLSDQNDIVNDQIQSLIQRNGPASEIKIKREVSADYAQKIKNYRERQEKIREYIRDPNFHMIPPINGEYRPVSLQKLQAWAAQKNVVLPRY